MRKYQKNTGDRRDGRSPREERPRRTSGERDDRPKRTFGSRDERPKRTFENREERPKRNFGERDDRPKRTFGSRDERPKRTFENREERPRRNFGERDDRPKRTFGSRDERPKRTFENREERPRRNFGERDDRPKRTFGSRDERPKRTFENREERPRRTSGERDDRPKRPLRPKAEEYIPKPRRRKALDEEGIRLNKFIANSGVCSRREADEYISAGLITVNGQVITELGTKIQSSDDVRFNGERLKGEEKVYILMNKPKDFVTTVTDPHAEKTVMDLIAGKCSQRVFPVGRLDKSTTGVLLLTNDGEIAEKLTHPSQMHKKIYHVFLDKNLINSDFKKLLEGITLEDGPINADALSYIDEDKSQVGLEIHSGRNRVVRRMFEHLGYKVKKLDRVYFAGLTKKNLRRGQWRFLTEQETAMLKMGAYE
jgi:23S rRNA pseudouridine2605 synthase